MPGLCGVRTRAGYPRHVTRRQACVVETAHGGGLRRGYSAVPVVVMSMTLVTITS
jgi:hypothetical protein